MSEGRCTAEHPLDLLDGRCEGSVGHGGPHYIQNPCDERDGILWTTVRERDQRTAQRAADLARGGRMGYPD